MNTKFLGISLAAVFAIGMTGFAFAGVFPAWLTVQADPPAAVVENGNNVLYSATMGDTIPHVDDDRLIGVLDTGKIVAGVAWLDVENFPVIDFSGATLHPEIVDSRQNPDIWHPHTGQLIFDYNGNGILCVMSLESPHAGIAINGDSIRMNMPARSAEVIPDEFDAATGFFLQPNGACPAPIGVDLPGEGVKPNLVQPPLPGLQVLTP